MFTGFLRVFQEVIIFLPAWATNLAAFPEKNTTISQFLVEMNPGQDSHDLRRQRFWHGESEHLGYFSRF